MNPYLEKLQTLGIHTFADRARVKITTDHHDDGTEVDVIEHKDGTQGINVRPATIYVGGNPDD